jgi:hypothetical protein
MTSTILSKYMYCIIRCPESRTFTSAGLGSGGVSTVHYDDLAVVVSDSPEIEYDSSRRNMMAHTLVIEEVMAEYNALPVRFSTIAPSVEAIQTKLLKRRYNEFLRLLDEMEGRAELSLKAVWADNMIFGEVLAQNPSLGVLRDQLANKNPDETYYERIRLGELVEDAVTRKRIEDGDHILTQLKPLAYKTRTNKLISERMVLNTAFLIDRSREAEFDQTIRALDAEMGQRIKFKYVGPVPPYNFVNIIVRWDE